MGQLTPELYEQCRQALLQCNEFADDVALQAVFVTRELRPFRPNLPQTNNIGDRVSQTLAYLLEKQLSNGRYILPLFLQQLTTNYQPLDNQHKTLTHLTKLTRISLSAAANPDQARLFICYKRNVQPDEQIALQLHQTLTGLGHHVFIDQTLRTGDDWLQTIDTEIKQSDFLIVLLSATSVTSEMVQAEIHRAYEHRQIQKHPQTLPIRINYDGMLPYEIAAFLNRVQHEVWRSEADSDPLVQHILAVIAGKGDVQSSSPIIDIMPQPQTSHPALPPPPLATFDPRSLTAPGGVVKPRDPFYVTRDADAVFLREIIKQGSTTTIRAPRQTGKTSLLVRGLRQAQKEAASTVLIDFQSLGREQFLSFAVFLREVVALIGDELDLDEEVIEKAWRANRSPERNMRTLMEKHILPNFDSQPLVLAFDEADRLLLTDFYRDFFRMLRVWHNRRATHAIWENFNLVMVIATEPYLLIDNIRESPFNVAYPINLPDFNAEQVQWLNQQHGQPLAANALADLMELFNGHPFLTRKALYLLAIEGMPWAQLHQTAADENGPFGDHLRRHYWGLNQDPDQKLLTALKQVLRHQRCHDENARLRLLRVGLIQGSGDVYTPRCGLYQQYFSRKFD